MNIYLTYGRMNPPTVGHVGLVHEMLKMAHENDGRVIVVVSHSKIDAKKKTALVAMNRGRVENLVAEKKKGFENPLSARQKILHLRHMFSAKKIRERFGDRVPLSFRHSSASKSIYKIVSELSNKYPSSKIHFVVGEDRRNDFKSLLEYGAHRIVSLKRPETSASATKARTHAVRDERDSFLNIMRGSRKTTNDMLRIIQKNKETNKKILKLMKKMRAVYLSQKG